MPIINGIKYACEPCMRGHRSSKCNHKDRILIKVRKPGRPLSSCPHEAGNCSCEVASVAIPKVSSNCPCGSPSGITKAKKEDKGVKFDRSRASSHAASMNSTPGVAQNINMGYGFPNNFIPNMDSDLVSPLDQNHLWQAQFQNNMNSMGGPADMNAPGSTPFYPNMSSPAPSVPLVKAPSAKKSCCKPENNVNPVTSPVDPKTFMDAAQNVFPGYQGPPLGQNGQFADFARDPRGRRHTTDMYGRKRASVSGYGMGMGEASMPQFHQGLDGRSTSVPNVPPMSPGMMNPLGYGNRDAVPPSDDSQNPGYTIYTAPRYNQSQVNYMNAIREAHEKQQQEEAEAARRASEAGEHAQRINNGSCCAPSDTSSGLDKTVPPYALPHGQECACGPNCSCIMCATHPYNPATIEYIRNIHQTMQTSEASSGEHSPSTQGFAHSVAGGADFPVNGSLGVFGDVSLDSTSDEKVLQGLHNDPHPLEMSPSAFIHVEYNLGTCAQANGACMCGDGCTCVGCLTHGGHNGVPLGMEPSALLSEPPSLEPPVDDSAPGANGQDGDETNTNQNEVNEITWKAEDSSSNSEKKPKIP